MTTLQTIAKAYGEFPSKFGIPRQSGLVETLETRIIFEPEFRCEEALRGIEGFSHLWLIWGFSEVRKAQWNPTVRPPRLGGNKRIGVFATRSTHRPNPIALSCVKLIKIDYTSQKSPILIVGGADLMNGTPIFDIKPYLTTTDCHPEASKGFVETNENYTLEVNIPEKFANLIPPKTLQTLKDVLAQDPRPAYHHDEERIYGFPFQDYEIAFSVRGGKVEVVNIRKA